MSGLRDRPADVLLDLLRSVGRKGYSVRFLIESGALFGFTENTVRVTLSRLLARELVESPARGRYRLARRSDTVNAFVERWRAGEKRVRPWTPGDWLFAHAASPAARGRWVLDALGFREARLGLWVRPDNLAPELAGLRALARDLGLGDDVLLVAGRPEGDPVPEAWVALWDPPAWIAAQRELTRRLKESAARLPGLPTAKARLESFRLGGEAIHCLAKDPLLPEALADPSARRALWEEMLAYDALGRAAWANREAADGQRLPVPQLAVEDDRE